jgi:hypothetical protein
MIIGDYGLVIWTLASQSKILLSPDNILKFRYKSSYRVLLESRTPNCFMCPMARHLTLLPTMARQTYETFTDFFRPSRSCTSGI